MGVRLPPLLAAFLSLGLAAWVVPLRIAAQEEAPAYIALGDSLAFGVGASEPALGYVGRASAALRNSERYRESGLDVINLSVPGARSPELLEEGGQLDGALREIEARRDDDDDVQVITIDIGGNDLLSLVEQGSPCLEGASVQPCRDAFGEVLSGIESNLREVLQRLREAAPDAVIVVVDLYNPYSGTGDPREAIAELGVGQANGVLGAVTADPELGVKTASIYQLFSGRGGQWISADGIHPNDNGHAVIAEAVVAAIADREPQVPVELLAPSPGETVDAAGGERSVSEDGDDGGVSTAILVAAIALAFVAGTAVSGAYFLARGRA